MPDKTEAGAKPKSKKSRRLLNPRRLQSLLRRVHEITLNDVKNPLLTVEQKLEYFKAGVEYAKLLAGADVRRRSDVKFKREAARKLGPLDSPDSPF
jgi:hypothetical protein